MLAHHVEVMADSLNHVTQVLIHLAPSLPGDMRRGARFAPDAPRGLQNLERLLRHSPFGCRCDRPFTLMLDGFDDAAMYEVECRVCVEFALVTLRGFRPMPVPRESHSHRRYHRPYVV